MPPPPPNPLFAPPPLPTTRVSFPSYFPVRHALHRRNSCVRHSVSRRRVVVPVHCVERPPSKAARKEGDVSSSSVGKDGGAGGEGAARGSLREDILWTGAWISVAAVAAGGVYWWSGFERMVEFVTAYVVEYSLSVDNLFVFLVIFRYFGVGRGLQLKALEWGIGGAVVMRGVMVVVGEALVQRFWWVSVLFGGLLLFTAGKLLIEGDGEGEEDVGESAVVRWVRAVVPVSGGFAGDRFWIQEAGRWVATPLLVVVLCIELSDVVFALDSVPAVLGVSDDAAVVYVSNLLAVVGLRNLYFVLSEAIGELRFLRFALAGVLGFVGAKMVGGAVAGWEVGVLWSLGVVLGVLGAGVGASLLWPEDDAGGVKGED